MTTGVEDIKQSCLECGRFCKNRRALGNHVNRSHKQTLRGLQGYVDKFFTSGTTPVCLCGCGQNVTWNKAGYRYNIYLSGHNEAGYTSKDFKHTVEQVEKRNDAIRQTYKLNGDVINAKISSSLLKTFSDPKYSAIFSELSQARWDDPEYRARLCLSQKEAWEKDHDERCARIFTPEFGAKISAANMLRNMKRSSCEEREFVQVLCTVFGDEDIEFDKWFNFTKKTWCADAWIKSKKLIVEFDGVYYHGLDRNTDFTKTQLINVTNDIIKNKIAIENNLSLVRIASNVDWKSIVSFDDLINMSYHYVFEGAVQREGTFKIDEKIPLISKEKLVSINEKLDGNLLGKEYTENELMPVITDLFHAHVSYHGWFYPKQTDELTVVLKKLKVVQIPETTLLLSTVGSTWLKAESRSYWNVDNGPSASFFDERALRSVLKYRLGLNASKPYKYMIDNIRIDCNETFDINLKNVRFGFVVQKKASSWFPPGVATSIYKKFLKSEMNPVVWDPSIGFSARMLGFVGAFDKGKYIGTDPAKQMYRDAIKVKELLQAQKPNIDIELHHLGSEFFTPEKDSLDLVFTSPPYFDIEKYYQEPGQCWLEYPTLDEWTEKYLKETFKNAFIGLKPGSRLVINIENNLCQTVVEAAKQVGFSCIDDETMYLPVRCDHFSKKQNKTSRIKEFVLVFKK